MGVASGCGEQEAGVASGSGWNLWVWLLGVVVRRYIDFLILLIPTPLVSVLFYSSIPTFCSFKKCFSFLSLENGADLHVNERQKIRHYRARSTEERRRFVLVRGDGDSVSGGVGDRVRVMGGGSW